MLRRLHDDVLKANFQYTFSSLTSRSSVTPSSLQPALEQVCDQLASWFASWFASCWQLDEDLCVHVVCVLRAGRKLDSVMEYGLNRSVTRFELSGHVEIAGTCLQQVGNHFCDQVCELDSIMEFSQSRSHASSRSSRTSSQARSRAR